ncbi:MAG: S-adenosylmethionine decarboxylase [bacterium]
MHIVSEIRVKDPSHLRDMESFVKEIDEILDNAGVQNLGKVCHDFDGDGYTVAVILGESHVAVHTWPDLGIVTCDVYLCNFKNDNSDKAENIHVGICHYFDSTHVNSARLVRI